MYVCNMYHTHSSLSSHDAASSKDAASSSDAASDAASVTRCSLARAEHGREGILVTSLPGYWSRAHGKGGLPSEDGNGGFRPIALFGG